MKTLTAGREKSLLEDIKAGDKTVEGRLYRDKFALCVVGDHVSLRADTYNKNGELIKEEPDQLLVEITKIERFDSFAEMLTSVGYQKVIPRAKSLEEAIEEYKKFYTQEQEKAFGVVAIHIGVIHIVAKILVSNSKGEILTLARGDTHPYFAGQLDFPGGEVDPGEDPIDAVIRELEEETKIKQPKSRINQVYRERVDAFEHYVFETSVEDSVKPKISWEHSSYRWMTKKEILATPIPEGVDKYYLTAIKYLAYKVKEG